MAKKKNNDFSKLISELIREAGLKKKKETAIEKFIKKHPLISVGAAFIIGYLLGKQK